MSAISTVVLLCLVGAPTPATSTPTPQARLAELVAKLGDKSYRARENAARQLLLQGTAAVAVLTEGTKHDDPEVSERCRQLLIQAPALERNKKLAALIENPSAPPPKGLPGLERFFKITGDDKPSRELYAEMASLFDRALNTLETDPKEAAKLYNDFCNDAYNRWYAAARAGRYNYDNVFTTRADIAFFLYFSTDARIQKNGIGANNAHVLLNGNQIPEAIDPTKGSVAMRKLFIDWLGNESTPHIQQQAFQLAARADVKEALPVALKLLKQGSKQPHSQATIMIAMVKLGGKEHISAFDPYLSDKSQVTSINFGDGRVLNVQMRDVAMGVQLQLAGEKMADYGFDNRFGGGAGMYPYNYGFPDDKTRDDAHAKWKAWAGKNLKNASGPAKDAKTPEKKEPEKK